MTSRIEWFFCWGEELVKNHYIVIFTSNSVQISVVICGRFVFENKSRILVKALMSCSKI